jgi:hypothetical protein
VGSSASFRASVQPLVRDAVMRGSSATEIASELRALHGHAYRRGELLADVRRYRGSSLRTIRVVRRREPLPAVLAAVARHIAEPRRLARAGVAVFAIALLVPAAVPFVRADQRVLVAAASETRALANDVRLPNPIAAERRAIVTPEPTPAPTPEPTPEPTPRPTPAPLVFSPGGPAVMVTASWYGPGFYENRLPCWPWLKANDLPIQYLPDTWGVAHKTLPCGTMLVLTHGPNTITVPVVDRGPYIAGRELDLSPRVKAALGCTDLCSVLMQVR